jgi:hypothetical protein
VFDVPALRYAARQSVPGTGVIIVDLDLRIVHADGPAIDKHRYETSDWPGSVRKMDQLSVSELRLQESERMVGVGSWEMVLETGVITYSGGFARLLGLSPGEPLDGGGQPRTDVARGSEAAARRLWGCRSGGRRRDARPRTTPATH